MHLGKGLKMLFSAMKKILAELMIIFKIIPLCSVSKYKVNSNLYEKVLFSISLWWKWSYTKTYTEI